MGKGFSNYFPIFGAVKNPHLTNEMVVMLLMQQKKINIFLFLLDMYYLKVKRRYILNMVEMIILMICVML